MLLPAGDSLKRGRNIPPVKASQTVAELPLAEPRAHPSLFEVVQHSHPELSVVHQSSSLLVDVSDPDSTNPPPTSPSTSTGTPTVAERGEPAVATIISLDEEEGEREDDRSHLFHNFTEDQPHPSTAHPNVRRARSLKHFTPPSDTSPPPSPFSPPATGETAPFISVQKATPKVWECVCVAVYGSPVVYLQPSTRRPVHSAKDRSGYLALSAADEGDAEEEPEAQQSGTQQPAIGRDRGHGRSTSLDLNKMIASSSVFSDMPSAEPPRPPPVSVSSLTSHLSSPLTSHP